jgi:hypothetical protein
VFKQDYCSEIANLFEITYPQSFAILMFGPNTGDIIAYQTVSGKDAESALLETYNTTVFGITEDIIKSLEHNKLNE